MSTPRRSLPAKKTSGGSGSASHAVSEPLRRQSQMNSDSGILENYNKNMSASPIRSQKTTHSKSIRLSDLMAAMYPGMKIGHKTCTEKPIFVPKTMGWLWNTEDTATGVPLPRGWRPGAVALGVRSDVEVGCKHYKRRTKFVTPCCKKVYTCRFCHDENETHPLNRKDVTELVCGNCSTRQKVQAECENCSLRFGKYTCLECKLFDDEDKNQYHCDGCGICRIGGRDKFFHCQKCNMCLPNKLQTGHKCIENVSRANCPVCLEDIHTSRIPCHIPDCGHLLHRTCFEDLLQSGLYTCPSCQTSLIDMTPVWEHYDQEIMMTPMPPEFKDYQAEILCKDCQKYSTIPYHVVGLKCQSCGSYNTTRTKTLRPDVAQNCELQIHPTFN